MSDIINNWVKEAAQGEGILALGVRYPDRSSFSWSTSKGFSSSELDGSLRCLADTFQVINAHRFPASRLRWVYAHAFVHGGIRADGLCLGIITRKTSAAPDQAAVERIFSEFQTLRS